MLHLHVRDKNGAHTLDANAYRAAVDAVRAKLGNDIFIQLTSEAAGIYSTDDQRRAIDDIIDAHDDFDDAAGFDGISIAPRELIRTAADRDSAVQLFHRLANRGIVIQYILYAVKDIAQYRELSASGEIPHRHSVLLVIGRGGNADPDTLIKMRDAIKTGESESDAAWMVCAFGENEFDCLIDAAINGGHVRIGFENCLRMKDGFVAADNAALIEQFIKFGNPHARPLADIAQARAILSGLNSPRPTR